MAGRPKIAAMIISVPPQFGQEALTGASRLRRLAHAPTDLLQLHIQVKDALQ
jgi:hypothetical protein